MRLLDVAVCDSALQCAPAWCIVSQYVALYCSVLQCVAACVAACCSVCCSVLQSTWPLDHGLAHASS